VFERILSLNPNDNQGVRFCLDDVQHGLSWQDMHDREERAHANLASAQAGRSRNQLSAGCDCLRSPAPQIPLRFPTCCSCNVKSPKCLEPQLRSRRRVIDRDVGGLPEGDRREGAVHSPRTAPHLQRSDSPGGSRREW